MSSQRGSFCWEWLFAPELAPLPLAEQLWDIPLCCWDEAPSSVPSPVLCHGSPSLPAACTHTLILQEGDHRWINPIARALQLLNSLYGPFGKTYGIGRCAKVWLAPGAPGSPSGLQEPGPHQPRHHRGVTALCLLLGRILGGQWRGGCCSLGCAALGQGAFVPGVVVSPAVCRGPEWEPGAAPPPWHPLLLTDELRAVAGPGGGERQ